MHLEAIWTNRQVCLSTVEREHRQEVIKDNPAVCIVLCHGRGPAATRLREVAAERLPADIARHVANSRIRTLRTFSDPDGAMLSILELRNRR